MDSHSLRTDVCKTLATHLRQLILAGLEQRHAEAKVHKAALVQHTVPHTQSEVQRHALDKQRKEPAGKRGGGEGGDGKRKQL